mgnify:CR=1 FL=1
MEDNKDNRKYPRIEKEVIVELKKLDSDQKDILRKGITKNISLGGAFIETRDTMEEGDEVQIKLRIPEKERELTVEGVVRWTTGDDPPGIGVEYTNVEMDNHPLTFVVD